jgi:hypothetical protein
MSTGRADIIANTEISMQAKFQHWIMIFIALAACVMLLSSASHGQANSNKAAILLRATLVQSLSMSAEPQGIMFNSFLSPGTSNNFPVTIKTNWVRGPGKISIAVVNEDFQDRIGEVEPLCVFDPGYSPAESSRVSPKGSEELSLESWNLLLPDASEKRLLTIRAQVI